MSKVIIKKSSVTEYLNCAGFTTDISKAQVFDNAAAAQAKIASAAQFGLTLVTVAAPVTKSFAVGYIRKGDLNTDRSIKSNTNNPSRRRFATQKEAMQHGSRFAERKAKGSRTPGSAGHIGYYLIETNDPVNSSVNPVTGLTNKL